METVYRDYAPKGVRFLYVYKALAHPELNGYVQPFTLQERLMHIREAKRTLGTQIEWICDSMDNQIKHAFGDAPNAEFIIDPEGRIVVRRAWSDPQQLRADLERLVGPVERITRVEDLDLPTAPPPQPAPRGIVPRVQRPANLVPLRQQPIAGEKQLPFYVKLRAEADPALLRGGGGTLYVGFHLDPLYHVHWNNKARPIVVRFVTANDEPDPRVEPNVLEGPKVEAPADIDPREFLVRVQRSKDDDTPLRIKVAYFACNDEQGWCLPVSQEYRVFFEIDPDAGRARPARGTGNRPPRTPPRGFAPPRPGPRRPDLSRFRPLGGRLVEIDPRRRQIVVETPAGERVELLVPDSARLVRDRRAAALDQFRRNDAVRLRYEDVRGRLVVRGMMAVPADPR